MSAIEVKTSSEAPAPVPEAGGAGSRGRGGTATTIGVAGPAGGGAGGAAVAPAAPADDAQELERPARRIALVGYTTSREEAPYDDPGWELWGMNDLHRFLDESKFTRWYDLHDLAELIERAGDKRQPDDRRQLAALHLEWLRTEHAFPIYVMDPFEGVALTPENEPMPPIAERFGMPSVVAFPKAEMLGQFMPYFTNSVSWQIGHAIWEAGRDESYVLTDLGLYGIDMAVASEYAAQRPSVEYFLGLIQGLGCELHIPKSSDLLKAAALYGGEDENSGMRAKITQRLRELNEQRAQLENAMGQMQAQHANILGALDSFAYMQTWMPPVAEGRDDVVVPFAAATPLAHAFIAADEQSKHSKE